EEILAAEKTLVVEAHLSQGEILVVGKTLVVKAHLVLEEILVVGQVVEEILLAEEILDLRELLIAEDNN
ncbi:MAG: hypothetical protein KAS15_06260, partial [Nanoarchaeota archaeon]|nr:hypothetical protein [Nanoarchaeota archaeon]